MIQKIDRFEGKYDFLSNFYDSPFCLGNVTYPTVVHYFQAQKTLDPEARAFIASASTPDQSKIRGRQAKLRDDWEQVKETIMYRGLTNKFKDRKLRSLLLMTGDATLIEGNTWKDTYWGVDIGTGEGKNRLGVLLMKLRQSFSDQWAIPHNLLPNNLGILKCSKCGLVDNALTTDCCQQPISHLADDIYKGNWDFQNAHWIPPSLEKRKQTGFKIFR